MPRTIHLYRQLVYVGLASGLALTACSNRYTSYEYFLARFSEKYCDAWSDCVGEEPCPFRGLDPQDHPFPPDCAYDASAARDCVRGRFECETQDGQDYVQVPAACDHYALCYDTGS